MDRILTVLATSESVSMVTEIATLVPSATQEAPFTATPIPTSIPTAHDTEAQPTLQVTEVPTPGPIPPEIAEQMDQIEAQVINIRELKPSGTVTRALLTREQLRQKIETDFFEDYSPEEAQEDSLVLSAFGLLEPGFAMFTFYQDLLSEQIAGQYDHKNKEMDIVQGFGFGGPERLTYAHEYTHALQDQNFDIENGLNYTNESCEEDSERCAAIQALLEGDASMLELDWFYNYATQQDMIDIQDFYAEYESPIYDSAPDFLREDFIFPYIYGQTFVEYLYNLGGWEAINDAYRNVPVSTEQILHPERYPADQPENVEVPDLMPILGEEWRELDRGVMGEWYTFLILAHGLNPEARLSESESKAASDGWGGDEYLVYYHDQNSAIALVMHTSWESVNDATQFYNAFQKHSTARFGAPANLQNNRIGWTHEGGYTELSTQNQFTTWVLAPDEVIAQQIWSAIYSP
ncbi:MAG: hypothetical protein IMY85_06500 [Chloroflexi bacterium]|nr:hypothetical protein [Chloroflexota bacterium]